MSSLPSQRPTDATQPRILRGSVLFIFLFAAIVGCFFQARPAVAYSGKWAISPVTIDLDRQVRSAVVTIYNQGQGAGEFEVKVTEWSQNDRGEDVQSPTKDIIYFPRFLKIAKNESRIIRLAARTPAVRNEKTYRLIVAERPDRSTPKGTGVSFQFQFSIPLFVLPPNKVVKGKILNSGVSVGKVRTTVTNEGNTRFRVDSVAVQGKNLKDEILFEKTITGWYILAGASKVYSVPVPADKCAGLATLDITIKARDLILKDTVAVDRAACGKGKQ